MGKSVYPQWQCLAAMEKERLLRILPQNVKVLRWTSFSPLFSTPYVNILRWTPFFQPVSFPHERSIWDRSDHRLRCRTMESWNQAHNQPKPQWLPSPLQNFRPHRSQQKISDFQSVNTQSFRTRRPVRAQRFPGVIKRKIVTILTRQHQRRKGMGKKDRPMLMFCVELIL